MSKSIDDLVVTHREKQVELLALGRQIAQSATPVVVAFVDLSESTELKQDNEPDAWLGYVFGFIQLIDKRCREAHGTTVKRIGDELMLTFSDTAKSEAFLQSLIADADSSQYTFKIALDAGDAYHFKFSDNLEDDPYGPVVDRCARIAKLAGPRTALCSSAYRGQVENPDQYSSVGAFSLRGFHEPENLFARSLVPIDSDAYVQPFVAAANEASSVFEGYRSMGRRLTTEYIRSFGPGPVRPFLARELINVPKLPYSAEAFTKLLGAADASAEKEKEFYGYLVEWECKFDGFKRNENDVNVNAELLGVTSSTYHRLKLRLPLSYSEIIRSLKKGQRLHVRGIIEDIFVSISLNYVDVSTVDVA
jgi:class 3 adenylate cyclase